MIERYNVEEEKLKEILFQSPLLFSLQLKTKVDLNVFKIF